MWECWKTLFLQVLDKHAPKRSKRLSKKGNVPWFNKTVKNKLFQRDHFKRVAIKTNNENDRKLYKSSRNAANIALQNAKGNTMQQNSSITKRTQNMRGKQLMRY